MRSAVLAGLALLAGCGENSPEQIDTVDVVAPEPASSPASAAGEQTFQALGTEPFWSFEVLDGKLLYTSPEQQTAVAIEAHVTAIGKHGDGGLVWEGRMDGKPVILTIREGQCSDGMSDTVYPYKATFTWGERTEQGCARLK